MVRSPLVERRPPLTDDLDVAADRLALDVLGPGLRRHVGADGLQTLRTRDALDVDVGADGVDGDAAAPRHLDR
jgi:hypothetical protein